ncbi:MAG: rhs core protein with extension [Candidatus Eremiobacteraeota bacterium]|nr:rhs core protein with extension [Candidatus Eremiobacteraeota bacterium]
MTTTVHYGSLVIPLAAQRRVDEAFGYLARDASLRSIVERLERSPVEHRIGINHRHVDSYQSSNHTIRWDPTSALRTSGGGRQSPALGLAHELDHAAENDDTYRRLQNERVPGYDSAEERRVITGSERHAAHTLHESVRYDHRGRVYRVAGPTQR